MVVDTEHNFITFGSWPYEFSASLDDVEAYLDDHSLGTSYEDARRQVAASQAAQMAR
jgi:hypothetical protein